MIKTRIISAAAAVALFTSALALYVQGDELIYDSQNDPLVSLSYINEVVVAGYEEKISELNDKLNGLNDKLSELSVKYNGLTETMNSLSKKNASLEAVNNTLQTSLVTASAKLDALEKELEELKNTPDGSAYEIVCLKRGQKLLATEPCEIILRSGKAIVVSITTNGVNDLTGGTELMNADAAPLYHSLLIPRGDGRGIQVTAEEAYIMVRGGYKIVD